VYRLKQVDAIIGYSVYHGNLGHRVLFIKHVEFSDGILVMIYFDTSNQDSLDLSIQIVHIPPDGKGY
jgi:hypothetical protein